MTARIVGGDGPASAGYLWCDEHNTYCRKWTLVHQQMTKEQTEAWGAMESMEPRDVKPSSPWTCASCLTGYSSNWSKCEMLSCENRGKRIEHLTENRHSMFPYDVAVKGTGPTEDQMALTAQQTIISMLQIKLEEVPALKAVVEAVKAYRDAHPTDAQGRWEAVLDALDGLEKS